MAIAKSSVVLAAVAAADVACLIGLVALGGGMLPEAPPSVDPAAAAAAGPARASALERAEAAVEADRAALAVDAVASWRARLERGGPIPVEAWEGVVRDLPDESTGHGESPPRHALRRLTALAAREPAAREALERLAFGSPELASDLRAVAANGICAAAPGPDLARIAAHLSAEPDERVLDGARAGLRRNPHGSGAGDDERDDREEAPRHPDRDRASRSGER